jgi:peptidoglycan/xylan/chitin deacetylase (PgdA/CDA1 family)
MDRGNLLTFFHRYGLTRVLRSRKSGKLTVLSLHRISPNKDYFFNPISPVHFEALLQYVSQNYSVITFSDIRYLLHGKPLHNKPYLILSFDDGYYDFLEYALPLLDKYKLPSNHNVVNACINTGENIWTQRLNAIFNYCRNNDLTLTFDFEGKGTFSLEYFKGNWMAFYLSTFQHMLTVSWETRMSYLSEKESTFNVKSELRMMKWEEVKECGRHRVEIGCHTYHHDVLSTIKNREKLNFEILQSKLEIEKNLHKPVNVLALPNGQMNPSINEVCRQAGLSHVLYVEDKVNEWNSKLLHVENPIYRIGMIDEKPPEMFLRAELFHSKLRAYA